MGPGAQGTLDFSIVLKNTKSSQGINPAAPRNRRRPKVADMTAGNGELRVDGRRVGTAHSFEVTTDEGARRYRGGAEFLQTFMGDFGKDDVIFGHCRASDDPRKNPCAVVGGTGRFAGARGIMTQGEVTGTKTTQTIRFRITFIP